MSNLTKAFMILVVLVTISVASFVFFTFPHWLYRVGTSEARSSSGSVGAVTIYKSTNDDYLFFIRNDSLVDEYVFYPSTGLIGIPSWGNFTYLRFLAYAKEIPFPVVMSSNKVKVETDMQIGFENGRLRFKTLRDAQIDVDLSNY